MLAIRLVRVGRKKLPMYRLIVQDSRLTPSGKFVAQLGHYNPHTKETVIDNELAEKYLKNGAQPSNSAAKLLQKAGVKLPEWVKIQTKNRSPKKAVESEAEAAPAKEKPADEPADEAPAEDSKEEKPAEEPVLENADEAKPAETAAPADKTDEPAAE